MASSLLRFLFLLNEEVLPFDYSYFPFPYVASPRLYPEFLDEDEEEDREHEVELCRDDCCAHDCDCEDCLRCSCDRDRIRTALENEQDTAYWNMPRAAA